MIQRQHLVSTILSAAAATGAGTAVNCKDYKTKKIHAYTAGMGSGDSIVFKVQCSDATSEPNWNAAASATNDWYFVDCKTLGAQTDVPGATGVTFSDANGESHLYVNDEGAKWLNINITTLSDTVNSSLTVKAALFE